jgi:hypothetical protein
VREPLQTAAPRRRNIKDIMPRTSGGGPAPTAGAVPEQTGATAQSPSSRGAASKNAPRRRKEPLPPPAELEAGVNRAVERDHRGLPPETNLSYANRELGTLAADLQQRSAILGKTGPGKLLANIDLSILPLGAADFMKRRTAEGRPQLENAFNRLLRYAQSEARAGRRDLLDQEIPDFLKSGTMGRRRIDNLEIRLGIDQIGVTDTTRKTTYESALMHEFKTLFYGETIIALLGLGGPEVAAFEHNPALGIHRPARSTESLPNRR